MAGCANCSPTEEDASHWSDAELERNTCGERFARFRASEVAKPDSSATQRISLLTALISAIVPGLGQICNGHLIKAACLFTAALFTILRSPFFYAFPWSVAVLDAWTSAERATFPTSLGTAEPWAGLANLGDL